MSSAATEAGAATTVLICGGGNGAHVLAGKAAVTEGIEARWLSTFGDEADRLAAPSEPLTVLNDLGEPIVAPRGSIKISKDPADVAPGADFVIMVVPATFHEAYLAALAPHLSAGGDGSGARRRVTIGALPGEGGFDVQVRKMLADVPVDVTVFALETLPWACRITEYAKVVEVLGTKKDVDVAVSPVEHQDATVATLQRLIGPLPRLAPTSLLSVTLMNINSVWHPTITYGAYRDWDGKPMASPPPFYEGVDDFTADTLTAVSDEIMAVKEVLLKRYADRGLDLGALRHVRDWMLRAYGDDVADKSSLRASINTNKGYRGLKHPTIKQEDGTYLPNWGYRYITEDIPCGLVVTAGIAELCGVPAPRMADVIRFGQSKMGKEFVAEDGTVSGPDIGMTRAPQRWGYKDLDTFMVEMGYLSS